MKIIMEEMIRMIEIFKMNYRGCCSNCLLSHGETDIYRIIEVKGYLEIELCKDCLSEFVKEINKAYSEMIGD